jgi:tRNA dimethylallyltransferase
MHRTAPDLPLVSIVGPTGAGKSSLAVRIAEAFSRTTPVEIVNCDSLQLYRGFDVGTAKVASAERRGIPHHMLDVLEPSEVYSAGEYARRARELIREISARAHLPVIAGGTGFYLSALLNGLPELPERDPALRLRLTARETRHPGILHRLLRRLDPAAAARVHIRDIQKTIRAVEISLLTRNPLPPPAAAAPFRGYRTLKIGLNPGRETLHKLLDARAAEMFRSGLIGEVEHLLSNGCTGPCTGKEKPFESLGYKQALQYLGSQITLDQAIASTQLETRQYAKRQWTWFRRDPEVIWLPGFGTSADIAEQALELIREFVS